MAKTAHSSGRKPHPGPARSLAMTPGGKAPAARKGRSRLHRTVIEHGMKGGGKVTHERVRKDADSYNGLRTEEQPAHMFGDNASMMAHLQKTMVPGGGVGEEAGEAVPDDEAAEA